MQIQHIYLLNHISLTLAPQKDITNLVLNYDHQRLTIKGGVSYTLLPINQIIFIAADSNYSTLYLANGKKIMTSKTLKVWEDKINHPFFIRCHRSYLVNVKYIDHISNKNNSIDILNHIIPISRNQKKAIVHWIK